MLVKTCQYLSIVSGGVSMKDFFANNFKKCPECGEQFSMFLYDSREYVYKVTDNHNRLKYLCSYPCYRKFKAKVEEKGRKK